MDHPAEESSTVGQDLGQDLGQNPPPTPVPSPSTNPKKMLRVVARKLPFEPQERKMDEDDGYHLASNCCSGDVWTVERINPNLRCDPIFILTNPKGKVEHLKPRRSPRPDEMDYGKKTRHDDDGGEGWNFGDVAQAMDQDFNMDVEKYEKK